MQTASISIRWPRPIYMPHIYRILVMRAFCDFKLNKKPPRKTTRKGGFPMYAEVYYEDAGKIF